MKTVRLYELAKELRLETRQVLADARRFGAMASSSSSSVDERTANRIRELYYPKKPAAAAHRAARLVKAHKPAETSETPAAERPAEDGIVPQPAPNAPEAAAGSPPPTASRTRIIKLAPKPAPIKPASPRQHAELSAEAQRPARRPAASHVAPPA